MQPEGVKPVENYIDMSSAAHAALLCFLPTGIIAAIYACMVCYNQAWWGKSKKEKREKKKKKKKKKNT